MGIPVYEQSLGSAEIQEAVTSGRYLVIALVDKTALAPAAFSLWDERRDLPGEVAYIGAYLSPMPQTSPLLFASSTFRSLNASEVGQVVT